MEYQDEPVMGFKGIFIPAEIWLDKSLSANEKMLYAEINSFTSNDLSCFISNQYIAEFLCVTETNASKILNSLIDKGLVEVTKFDGRKRYVIARQPCQICKSESLNLQDINITIEHKEKENILKESEIVDFWNENTKDYPKVAKVSTSVKRAIHARIKEGYTVEQIKQAILLMNSLGDFYKGKNNNHWKADFLWIMQNTKGNFEKILAGGLHTTQLQQQQFNDVMRNNGVIDPNEYRPATGGYINFSQSKGMYWTHISPEFGQILDGYKDDTRPDGAVLGSPFGVFKWSAAQRCWNCENND